MRFNSGDDFSDVILGNSYSKNYKFLLDDMKYVNNSGLYSFNSISIFKYKRLILKYNRIPNKYQIKVDIQKFIDKVNQYENLKIFNMECITSRNTEGLIDYIVNVTFINLNLE